MTAGKIGLALGAVLLAIQLVPVPRDNPPVESEVPASEEAREVLRRACYDCHSHETRWPWYGYVAPLSWWLEEHIHHARDDMNLSRWPTYDLHEQEYIFEDIREEILEDEMPLKSYRIMHAGARLTEADKEILLEWARP